MILTPNVLSLCVKGEKGPCLTGELKMKRTVS